MRRSAVIVGLGLWTASLAVAARPGPDAVWKPTAAHIGQIHANVAATYDPDRAVVTVMRTAKAPAAAIALAERLPGGYLGELKDEGKLALGTLYFPLRANNNAEPLVIDAQGKLVRPATDDLPPYAELAAHPGMEPLRAKGDEVYAWTPQAPPEVSTGADGTTLVYEYPLRICHACADLGVVRIAYVFDAGGVFKARQIRDVRRAKRP